MKTKLLLLFGGRSTESEVSVLTALGAMNALDTEKYEILPVYVADGGNYITQLLELREFAPFVEKTHERVELVGGAVYSRKKDKLKLQMKPHVALLCTHGGQGENGVLQAVLEWNGIPYTSADTLGSAVGMDKLVQKRLFSEMYLNVLDYVVFQGDEIETDSKKCALKAESYFDFPMITKPSSQGSSIGISLAENADELAEALKTAAEFGDTVIVERALTNFTEINCAAFKRGNDTVVSETEQPVNWRGFLSFEDKYIGGKYSADNKNIMPAPVGDFNDKVKELTKKIYTNFRLRGVVRVDYLLDNSTGKLFVNEINTIPGSLAHYLFAPVGVSYSELLDELIREARSPINNKKKQYRTDLLTLAAGNKMQHCKK